MGLPTQNEPRQSRTYSKVVGTIGPASEDLIEDLLEAGLSVARINFSHGTHEDHRRRVGKIRAASEKTKRPVALLADIQGPKMRLGTIVGGSMYLKEDQRVRLVEGEDSLIPEEIPFNFPGFFARLEPGHRVFLADGAVQLTIEESSGSALLARVRRGGMIGDRKGVHLPDTEIALKVPTDDDIRDLALVKELEVDFVGVSFVARAEELRIVRRHAPDALMVAKIERFAALENLAEILDEADGIMVARGDLGVEAQLEQVPILQKQLIRSALKAGKFVITATEMLESMVTASRPTRAEVADVANAVIDGTDALMLSAETAVGRYPVESVAAMIRISRAVEGSELYVDLPRVAFRAAEPDSSNATALAAVQAAKALHIKKIVCFTETGNTARLLSRYRPLAEIVALSPHPQTVARMLILAHVTPILFGAFTTLEEMLAEGSRVLLDRGLVEVGEEIVFVAGVPPGVARSTNVLKLHRIGESLQLATH